VPATSGADTFKFGWASDAAAGIQFGVDAQGVTIQSSDPANDELQIGNPSGASIIINDVGNYVSLLGHRHIPDGNWASFGGSATSSDAWVGWNTDGQDHLQFSASSTAGGHWLFGPKTLKSANSWTGANFGHTENDHSLIVHSSTLSTVATDEWLKLTATAGGADARIETGSGDLVLIPASGKVVLNSGPSWSSGTGTPEGVVTAPIGSMFSRTDGGAGTALYVKETGTGNTGWVGK